MLGFFSLYLLTGGARSSLVVKALHYKPAGRGFDSRWCHWNFSVTLSFRSHYGLGVNSASNRNEYQVYFLGVKAAGAYYGPGVDSASNRNEYQVYFLGVKAAGVYGWQPYHHSVPLSWNLGNLTSWNPLGHSRLVTGLLETWNFTVFTNNIAGIT